MNAYLVRKYSYTPAQRRRTTMVLDGQRMGDERDWVLVGFFVTCSSSAEKRFIRPAKQDEMGLCAMKLTLQLRSSQRWYHHHDGASTVSSTRPLCPVTGGRVSIRRRSDRRRRGQEVQVYQAIFGGCVCKFLLSTPLIIVRCHGQWACGLQV